MAVGPYASGNKEANHLDYVQFLRQRRRSLGTVNIQIFGSYLISAIFGTETQNA